MIFPSEEYICKWCGGLFTPHRTTQRVCSPGCAISFNSKRAKEKETKKQSKELNKKIKDWKPIVHAKQNKINLQKEVNKLARLIDAQFGYTCIDCGRNYGKQVDGAHFHGVGSNSSTRYNLHNIHSAKSECNQFSDKHKQGYRAGLTSRYGLSYLLFVESLPVEFKEIHLGHSEIADKLKIVRKINKSFDTYQLSDSISARDIFNKIIGIYK